MWFSRLKITISQSPGENLFRKVFAQDTPANPPPTITIFGHAISWTFQPANLALC